MNDFPHPPGLLGHNPPLGAQDREGAFVIQHAVNVRMDDVVRDEKEPPGPRPGDDGPGQERFVVGQIRPGDLQPGVLEVGVNGKPGLVQHIGVGVGTGDVGVHQDQPSRSGDRLGRVAPGERQYGSAAGRFPHADGVGLDAQALQFVDQGQKNPVLGFQPIRPGKSEFFLRPAVFLQGFPFLGVQTRGEFPPKDVGREPPGIQGDEVRVGRVQSGKGVGHVRPGTAVNGRKVLAVVGVDHAVDGQGVFHVGRSENGGRERPGGAADDGHRGSPTKHQGGAVPKSVKEGVPFFAGGGDVGGGKEQGGQDARQGVGPGFLIEGAVGQNENRNGDEPLKERQPGRVAPSDHRQGGADQRGIENGPTEYPLLHPGDKKHREESVGPLPPEPPLGQTDQGVVDQGVGAAPVPTDFIQVGRVGLGVVRPDEPPDPLGQLFNVLAEGFPAKDPRQGRAGHPALSLAEQQNTLEIPQRAVGVTVHPKGVQNQGSGFGRGFDLPAETENGDSIAQSLQRLPGPTEENPPGAPPPDPQPHARFPPVPPLNPQDGALPADPVTVASVESLTKYAVHFLPQNGVVRRRPGFDRHQEVGQRARASEDFGTLR